MPRGKRGKAVRACFAASQSVRGSWHDGLENALRNAFLQRPLISALQEIAVLRRFFSEHPDLEWTPPPKRDWPPIPTESPQEDSHALRQAYRPEYLRPAALGYVNASTDAWTLPRRACLAESQAACGSWQRDIFIHWL